jgi:phosphatidylglycerol:prolipoprotein diacylglycerol transferase
MTSILFKIGNIPIMAHGFFFLLALVIGMFWLMLEGRRRNWPKDESFPIITAAFVGGMIGARISIVFLNGWETAPVVLNFFYLFDPRIGPGSIVGGVVGAYIGGFFASRIIGKAGCACDAFAPAMALAMVIGRIGCFLSLEDGLGKPTTAIWGVWNGFYKAHPSPLYDAGFNLVWFLILLGLRNHKWMQNGNLLKFGVGGYAVARFFIEFTRNNRVILLGLTGQQLACLALLLGLAIYYIYRSVKQKQSILTHQESSELESRGLI